MMQVICHGIPDKRPLEDGDIVNVDVSAYYKGYHGDLNETYVVGNVDEASKKLIKAAHDVSCCCTPSSMTANAIFVFQIVLRLCERAFKTDCEEAWCLSGYSKFHV